MRKLKVLDLFSGIGTFSYAFHRTGEFETVAFCEWDKECHKVLKKNFPGVPIFTDIATITFEKDYLVQGDLRVYIGDVDVIVGGFPCTDASVAGKKKGLFHEGKITRSGHWVYYKEIIEHVKPRWVLIENVRNLLNLGFASVIKDLHEIGANAEWEVISARDVGACHLRERLWIIAYPHSTALRNITKREERGWDGIQAEGEEESAVDGSPRGIEIADSDHFRFWPTFATEEAKQKWWSKATAEYRDWWKTLPETGGVYDGPTERLHERARQQRIKQLGNGIVEPIAHLHAMRILFHEAVDAL